MPSRGAVSGTGPPGSSASGCRSVRSVPACRGACPTAQGWFVGHSDNRTGADAARRTRSRVPARRTARGRSSGLRRCRSVQTATHRYDAAVRYACRRLPTSALPAVRPRSAPSEDWAYDSRPLTGRAPSTASDPAPTRRRRTASRRPATPPRTAVRSAGERRRRTAASARGRPPGRHRSTARGRSRRRRSASPAYRPAPATRGRTAAAAAAVPMPGMAGASRRRPRPPAPGGAWPGPAIARADRWCSALIGRGGLPGAPDRRPRRELDQADGRLAQEQAADDARLDTLEERAERAGEAGRQGVQPGGHLVGGAAQRLPGARPATSPARRSRSASRPATAAPTCSPTSTWSSRSGTAGGRAGHHRARRGRAYPATHRQGRQGATTWRSCATDQQVHRAW